MRDAERRVQRANDAFLEGRERSHTTLEALVREADALGYPPLQVDTRARLGDALAFSSQPERAIEVLEEGAALGLDASARLATAALLMQLARIRVATTKDTEQALFLARISDALAQDLPDAQRLKMDRTPERIDILLAAGQGDRAEEAARALVAYREQEKTLEDPSGVLARALLAHVLMNDEQIAEAGRRLDGILEDPTIADEHPNIARSYVYRARLRSERDDIDGAIADHRAAYERFSALYGSQHINAAGRLSDLAQTLVHANRLEDAREPLRRAVAMVASARRPPDRQLASMTEKMGWIELNLGHYDEALESLEAAERWSAGLPSTSSWRLLARGRIAEARGAYAEAEALFAQAQRVAPDDADRTEADVDLTVIHLLQGRADGAKARLLTALDDDEISEVSRGRAAYGLALLELRRGQAQTARHRVSRGRTELRDTPYERMLRGQLDAVDAEL